MKYIFFVVVVFLVGVFAVDFYLTHVLLPRKTTLHSLYQETLPTIDGMQEQAWDLAQPLHIPVTAGANQVAQEVELRSMHNDQDIVFLARWADNQESLSLQPWVLAQDNWQKKATARYDENVFAEDKFSFIWAIKGSVFANNGCGSTCHSPAGGKDYGAKYAPGNELLDLWQWGSVTTNPLGMMDDMFLDKEQASPQNFRAGIKHDVFYNEKKKNKVPSEISETDWFRFIGRKKNTYPTNAKEQLPLIKTEAAMKANPNEKVFLQSNQVGAFVYNTNFQKSIEAKGKFQDGFWTLEIKRKRITNDPADLQMPPKSHRYIFSIAVFNNSLLRHSYAQKVYRLAFEGATNAH